jgi:hypothetical protein
MFLRVLKWMNRAGIINVLQKCKGIIIIIILGISFMQGIYTYIPETNHVPREHRVATILM